MVHNTLSSSYHETLALAWKPVNLASAAQSPSDVRCLLLLVGICVYVPGGDEIRSTTAAQARLVLSTVSISEVFTNALLSSQPRKRLYHSCVLAIQ